MKMSKNERLALSALFLMISLFVSGSLVLNLHEARAAGEHQSQWLKTLHLLQNA